MFSVSARYGCTSDVGVFDYRSLYKWGASNNVLSEIWSRFIPISRRIRPLNDNRLNSFFYLKNSKVIYQTETGIESKSCDSGILTAPADPATRTTLETMAIVTEY